MRETERKKELKRRVVEENKKGKIGNEGEGVGRPFSFFITCFGSGTV